MPYGPLRPADADPGSADCAPPPPANRHFIVREPAHGAESGGDPAAGPPSSGALLGDFLALITGIEADFTLRWDAARLGGPTGVHQQPAQPGWRHHV